MWYYSLKHVVKNIREGNKWRRMSDIQMPRKHEKSKNAIYPARYGETWVKYIKYLERSQYQIQELLKQSEELLDFSCTLSMRERLEAQMKLLNIWIEDSKTTDYLLMTQYNKVRAMRVEIRVLRHKVAALLRQKLSREKLSMGSVPSKIVRFSPSKHTRPFFRQQPAGGKIKKRRSKTGTIIPPKWYKILPRAKKSLVRKIVADDIGNVTLSSKTVGRVCSNFGVSREQVDAMARYLDKKYALNTIITKSLTV